MSAVIEAGFRVKESVTVFLVSKLCHMRIYSQATVVCSSMLLDRRLTRQAPFALPPKTLECNGCAERANAAGRCECCRFCAVRPSTISLNVELASQARRCNVYRPH